MTCIRLEERFHQQCKQLDDRIGIRKHDASRGVSLTHVHRERYKVLGRNVNTVSLSHIFNYFIR